MHRGYQFRLYPTPAQATAMRQTAGTVRFVYNLALEQRAQFGRQFRRVTGRTLNSFSQSAELNPLRAEVEWIRAAPRVCLEQALRDLDQAFAAFFTGRARFPTPRKKGLNDAFRTKGPETATRILNAKWAEVWVAKIGWVKFRATRPHVGRCANVTFSLRAETWFVAFACEQERAVPCASDAAVGIDRGVANGLALSTGELFRLPAALGKIEASRRKAQRILARRMKGSKRRQRQRLRVARLYAKARNIRRDWQHKVTTEISRRFGVVALEDLKILNMTARAHNKGVRQKAGLNRAILNVGWGSIAQMLDYKLAACGGRVVMVPAAYTSQACSECGTIDTANRKSQAVFVCVACGHEGHADVNAAMNIRRALGPSLGGEGGHRSPREPSTLAA